MMRVSSRQLKVQEDVWECGRCRVLPIPERFIWFFGMAPCTIKALLVSQDLCCQHHWKLGMISSTYEFCTALSEFELWKNCCPSRLFTYLEPTMCWSWFNSYNVWDRCSLSSVSSNLIFAAFYCNNCVTAVCCMLKRPHEPDMVWDNRFDNSPTPDLGCTRKFHSKFIWCVAYMFFVYSWWIIC